MISTAYAPEQYVGNGSTVAFAVDWPYFANSDLVVTLRDDAAGTDALQVIGADYTASTPSPTPGTGTVTFVTAPPSGQTVIIERATPLTQSLDYVEGDSFPSKSTEDGLDRGLLHDQERKDDMERTPAFPATDPVASRGDLPDSATRLSKYAGYDAESKPIAIAGAAGDVTVSAFMETVLDDGSAAAARATLGALYNGASVERCGAGVDASKWAAATNSGFYYATDTHRLYYSNKSAWFQIGLELYAQDSLPGAATAGRRFLDTSRYQPWYDDGSNLQPIRHFPTGHKHGCSVAYATATTFIAQVGGFRDSSDVTNLTLASALTKTVNTSGVWVAGADGSAFTEAAPTTVSTWFRVFLIGKDDGSVDVGCDSSATAANLLAESTYDWYIRIGWIWLDGSEQLVAWTLQGDDEWNHWDAGMVIVADAGDVDYSAGVQVACAAAPPNTQVLCGETWGVTLADYAVMGHGDVSIAQPADVTHPIADFEGSHHQQRMIFLNGSSEFYVRTIDNAARLYMSAYAWRDNRQAA